MSTNITKVYLLQVPLENDYKHTFYFGSAGTQYQYFLQKKKHEFTDFSYQRKDSTIRVPIGYDEAIQCNYVMYQNPAYNNKWFYAFITDYEYRGEDQTNIKIETDVMQTWMFDYDIKPSFVEREHTNDDTMGNNVVDETLQLGDYICNKRSEANYGEPTDQYIIIGVTKTSDGKNAIGSLYNGVYSGLKYYYFKNNSVGIVWAKGFLDEYDDEARGEAVQCMFMLPKHCFKRSDETANYGEVLDDITANSSGASYYFINNDTTGYDGVNLTMSTKKLDGFTPNNNKLLTYPYRYLMVANNSGVSVPMKYEDFYTTDSDGKKTVNDPRFVINGALSIGGSVKMTPIYYKGVNRNYEEGINLGKYPTLNWTSDVYTNWLTQNAVNIGLSIGGDIVQSGLGVLVATSTGGIGAMGGGGMLVSGATSIGSTLGEMYKVSLTPPQSKGNTNSGDVTTAMGINDFHFYDMTIKRESAMIIDEYFDMFGYKTNRVKVPYKNHRKTWWFTKTIDVNITYKNEKYVPISDIEEIKRIYNNGVTFWKNTDQFKNYGYDNSIV